MCANFFPGRLEIISASTISILAPSMCQQTSVLVFDFIFRSARHCRFFMSVGCLLCCRFVSQKPSSRSPVIFPVFRSTVSACCCVCPLSSILFFVFCLSSNILLLCSFPLSLLCRLFFVVHYHFLIHYPSFVLPWYCFLWHLCHDVICKGGGVHCPGDFDVHATPFLRHVIYCCDY